MPEVAVAALLAASAPPFSTERLHEAWPQARFVHTPAPCLRHAELVERLHALERRHAGRLTLEEAGRSVEGRPLFLLTLGSGPRKLLLWSQMHGDEPSATPALLDVADFLLAGAEAPDSRRILEGVTLLMLPMLNPDGAERYERRNAQGIDINRDALNLATPEGRALKALRDRFRPELGFNLHDQGRRTTVGNTGVPATLALLAVAGDARGTLTPGRARARRVCSAIARDLASLLPGGVSRYDEDWSPRAFGDNLTAWGTPVVLVESGAIPAGGSHESLTRLNFVALLRALHGLAVDDLAGVGPEAYESLERNEREAWADVVVRGGRLLGPGPPEPYRADLAFDLLDGDRSRAGCGEAPRGGSRVVELGDARYLSAGRSIDAQGAYVVPAFAASVRGLSARAWLDAASLGRLGRLGVASLRWHVGPEETRQALAHLAALPEDGVRPSVAVVSEQAPSAWLSLAGPLPALAAPLSLLRVVEALAGPSWRSRAPDASLAGLVGRLAGRGSDDDGEGADREAGGARGAAGTPRGKGGQAQDEPALAVGSPASLVILRPLPGREGPSDLEIEAVLIDGREAKP